MPKYKGTPALRCDSRVIRFPVESEMMRYILANSPIKMTSVKDNVISTRLNYLEIGSAKVLTIPGEALPNIGFYIKRKMNTDHPFLFGLTNDAFGYMLTRVDFNSFKRYDYVSRTSLGEMTGEIYIDETVQWLNEISGRCCIKKVTRVYTLLNLKLKLIGMTRTFISFSCSCSAKIVFVLQGHGQPALTPETALQGYLNNGDKAYRWELKETYPVGDAKAYSLLLTSQQWHEYIWTHQLTILVPAENNYDAALLFITGGSNKKGLPNWNGKDDKFLEALGGLATKNKSIVALLRQTPNQPLYEDLTEDALISYTLHQFKEDGDYSWPLLFPMVKSAVRAMDAVQEFAKQTLNHRSQTFCGFRGL